jgi:hypothetical protein
VPPGVRTATPQPIPDGPVAQADGVGERLRRPRLSNVAAARPVDKMQSSKCPKLHRTRLLSTIAGPFPPFPMSSRSFPALPGMIHRARPSITTRRRHRKYIQSVERSRK